MSDQGQPRPEALPNNLVPVNRFTFTTNFVEGAKKDNQALIDRYSERIDKIAKALMINDMPIIPAILSVTKDKAELKRLAQGIDRVADLAEVLDELQTRQNVLEYAERDPMWFAAAFADLEHEVNTSLPDDADIEELLKVDNA